MNELKNFVYVSIISADNDEFGLTEDEKQEIMRRYKMEKNPSDSKHSPSENGDLMGWEYILEPIKDERQREMLIDFFKSPEE